MTVNNKAGKESHDLTRKPGMQAALFNLVVYSAQEGAWDEYQDFIANVIAKYPCRIFLIQQTPDKEVSIQITTAQPQQSSEESNGYCELTRLGCEDSDKGKVSSILMPHLLADLPIELFWGSDPTADTFLLPQLMPFASRLIFDSGKVGDLGTFFSRAADCFDDSKIKIAVVDTHWTYMSPWRAAISQIFHSEKQIDEINSAKVITIRYNAVDSDYIKQKEIRALYLMGWLAGQLRWQYKGREGGGAGATHFRYSHSHGDCTFILRPEVSGELEAADIIAIEVEINDEEYYSLKQNCSLDKISVRYSCSDRCDLPYSLPLANSPYLCACLSELLFTPPSPHYHNTLHALREVGT